MEGSKFDFGGYRHTKENAMLIKQRRQRILEMRDSGLSFDEISKAFGLSKARCRKIYSTASNGKKPKSLNVSFYVRDVLRSHLPLLILKEGSYVKMNYPLLFIVLESKNDYFRQKKAKQYIRMIVHSSRQELLNAYNNLLLRFGHNNPAKKWIRSEGAVVPSCFWNNKEIESFLLSCLSIKHPSQDAVDVVLQKVKQILDVSPDFSLTDDENAKETKLDLDNKTLPGDLLNKSDELVSYIEIIKSDESLKREDYIFVLDSALDCLKSFRSMFSSPVVEKEPEEEPVKEKDKEPIKEKPKAFWPKPKF
jgi:hypothetical protein